MELKAGCALAATVIALTGCGGSESGDARNTDRQGSPPRDQRLSKAEAKYVQRLDAACKEGDEMSARVRAQANRLKRRLLPKAETNRRVVKLLDKSYVESDKVRDRIRRVKAPPSERDFRRRYLALSGRLDELNKRGRDAIARGDDLGPLRLETNLLEKRRATLVADHGGFRYCG